MIMVFWSCSYAPQWSHSVPEVPEIENKGDLSCSGTVGINRLDLSFHYSPIQGLISSLSTNVGPTNISYAALVGVPLINNESFLFQGFCGFRHGFEGKNNDENLLISNEVWARRFWSCFVQTGLKIRRPSSRWSLVFRPSYLAYDRWNSDLDSTDDGACGIASGTSPRSFIFEGLINYEKSFSDQLSFRVYATASNYQPIECAEIPYLNRNVGAGLIWSLKSKNQ